LGAHHGLRRLLGGLASLAFLIGCGTGAGPTPIPRSLTTGPSTAAVATPKSAGASLRVGTGGEVQLALPVTWKWVFNQAQLDALIAELDPARATALKALGQAFEKPGYSVAFDTSSRPLPGGRGLTMLVVSVLEPGPHTDTLEQVEFNTTLANAEQAGFSGKRHGLPAGSAFGYSYRVPVAAESSGEPGEIAMDAFAFLVLDVVEQTYTDVRFLLMTGADEAADRAPFLEQVMQTLRFPAPLAAVSWAATPSSAPTP
jgi:hypothetical protein